MPPSTFDYGSGGPDETFSQYKARRARIEALQRAESAGMAKVQARQAALDQVTPAVGVPAVACVDCQFYKVAAAESRCRHVLARVRVGNIVDGFRMTQPRCDQVRLDPEQCGPNGRWWVKVSALRRFFR